MKFWNSAFNAQGSSRVIIVVVQVGAVKISVAAVDALRKKERGDETQFTTKIDGKFIPSYAFDGLLSWNWQVLSPPPPPNRLTLPITFLG